MFGEKILYYGIVNDNPAFVFSYKGYYFYLVVGKDGNTDSFSSPKENLNLIKERFKLNDIAELDPKYMDRIETANKKFEREQSVIDELIEHADQKKLRNTGLI